MKRFYLFALSCLLTIVSVYSQNISDPTTKHPYVYENFKAAQVNFASGKTSVVKEANVYLDGSKLYYRQNGNTMVADLSNVLSVDFGTDFFVVRDSMLARRVAVKGNNVLFCVTTIDKKAMKGGGADGMADLHNEGKNLPFFHIEGMNGIMQMDDNDPTGEVLPLKKTYYYIINTVKVPANETAVRKTLSGDKKSAFKEKMKDRNWSWKDENSLVELMNFL